MSYTIPSTSDLVSRNKSNFESRLNQTTPAADKAFNTVLATVEALAGKSLYAYAADRVKANFVTTASGDDLDAFGAEYDVPRDAATAWEGTATLPADDDTEIPLGTEFDGPQGLTYVTQASATASDGAATVALVCEDSGASGNLSVDDELTLKLSIDGAESTATVTGVTSDGTEEEEDDDYRQDILDVIRAEGGGGDASDYRTWAQAVAGVKRAYPFSGPPADSGLDDTPALRTVYIESTTDIDEEGIPSAALLATVKNALLYDPDTGSSRQILGLTSDTLHMVAISRTPIYVTISGLSVTIGTTSAAQTAVEAALETCLKQFAPFVQGLDADFERMDSVTAGYLTREVQDVLDEYGGSCQSVLFGTSAGTYLGIYELGNGEKVKLGGVTWEDA